MAAEEHARVVGAGAQDEDEEGAAGAAYPCVDVGRMAIGQDKVQTTPLQMAMVAASVSVHPRRTAGMTAAGLNTAKAAATMNCARMTLGTA